MEKRKMLIVIAAFVTYLVATSISYAMFSGNKKTFVPAKVPQATKDATGKTVFDDSLPKTESCPLNGTMYSKQQRVWWEKHRPLGIMIENHENARPQSGLSSADVVYEAVAEGGITRFLAVYYCKDAPQVGPVRSARTYFIDYISEYGNYPLYAHVGGANTPGPADALGQLSDYGWAGYNDMNQFSISFPTFWRDYDRLGHTTETEHTMYSSTEKLWDFAKKDRELTNVDKNGDTWDTDFVKYTFKDDKPAGSSADAKNIHVEHWKSYQAYAIDWTYDQAANNYQRNNGGEAHIDQNTKKQITAKNIVVLFMAESNANDGYENNAHMLYKTKGSGKATFFMDGKKISGRWTKDSRTARTELTDAAGAPIKLNKGTIWFQILPTEREVEVK